MLYCYPSLSWLTAGACKYTQMAWMSEEQRHSWCVWCRYVRPLQLRGRQRKKKGEKGSLHACCCCPFSRLVNKLCSTFEWSAHVCVCERERERENYSLQTSTAVTLHLMTPSLPPLVCCSSTQSALVFLFLSVSSAWWLKIMCVLNCYLVFWVVCFGPGVSSEPWLDLFYRHEALVAQSNWRCFHHSEKLFYFLHYFHSCPDFRQQDLGWGLF